MVTAADAIRISGIRSARCRLKPSVRARGCAQTLRRLWLRLIIVVYVNPLSIIMNKNYQWKI